jgi:hypothetical protein
LGLRKRRFSFGVFAVADCAYQRRPIKMPSKKPGLYANINAKRERIAEGSGEKMRKVGSKGAPTKQDFKESAKTAKMKAGGSAKKACW